MYSSQQKYMQYFTYNIDLTFFYDEVAVFQNISKLMSEGFTLMRNFQLYIKNNLAS